jgi:hypothetical protein
MTWFQGMFRECSKQEIMIHVPIMFKTFFFLPMRQNAHFNAGLSMWVSTSQTSAAVRAAQSRQDQTITFNTTRRQVALLEKDASGFRRGVGSKYCSKSH